jgi:succinate dehydrogenase subunit C
MPVYSEYQPRKYHRATSNWWWLERFNYLRFMLREFSSLFVGYFLVVVLIQMCAVAGGKASYATFQAWMSEPLMIIVNIIAFLFLVLHAMSWSSLVPRAVYPRHHGRRVSEAATAGPSYILWIVATAVLAFFILGA